MKARYFFSPAHARHQLVISTAGLWPTVEEWKRRVFEIVVQEGGETAELWDFTGADFRFTAEPVPRSTTPCSMDVIW